MIFEKGKNDKRIFDEFDEETEEKSNQFNQKVKDYTESMTHNLSPKANDNFNFILNKCKKFMSSHIGSVETAISRPSHSAIITVKIPLLIFTQEILEFLIEAQDKVENIMIFPYGGKQISIKIAVEYFDSGESELQKAANKLFHKEEDI